MKPDVVLRAGCAYTRRLGTATRLILMDSAAYGGLRALHDARTGSSANRSKLFFHQNLTSISRLQSSSPLTSYFKRSVAIVKCERPKNLVHSQWDGNF
jgi:hypothetical protein